MTALLYTWAIATDTILLPASTTRTIHSLYISDWCMPTYYYYKDVLQRHVSERSYLYYNNSE